MNPKNKNMEFVFDIEKFSQLKNIISKNDVTKLAGEGVHREFIEKLIEHLGNDSGLTRSQLQKFWHSSARPRGTVIKRWIVYV